MREFVPAATAGLRLQAGAFDGLADGRTVTVATVLPGIVPALARPNGEVRVAVQVAHQSADPSRDFAEALRLGLLAEPGQSVVMTELPGPGVRLQDVVAADNGFEITVHEGFDFWFDDNPDPDGTAKATLENLNAAVDPTQRLTSVEGAYWTAVTAKEHLRWVLPYDEEQLLTALARLHAVGADQVGSASRLVGSFRAHGLLVPVWDLPTGTGAAALEEPAAAFLGRLEDALADTSPITAEQRSARSGLSNRQVTIR